MDIPKVALFALILINISLTKIFPQDDENYYGEHPVQQVPQDYYDIRRNYFVLRIRGRKIRENLQIRISINSQYVKLKGCRQGLARYSYNQNQRKWSLTDEFSLKQKECPYGDLDYEVIKSLKYATNIQRSGFFVMFNDDRGYEALKLQLQGSTYERRVQTSIGAIEIYKPLPSPTILSGKYQVTFLIDTILIRKITVTFLGSVLVLQGCNVIRTFYQYNQRTARWRIQDFSGTRIFCEDDQDKIATKAFYSVVTLVRYGTAYRFYNRVNLEKIRIVPFGQPDIKQISSKNLKISDNNTQTTNEQEDVYIQESEVDLQQNNGQQQTSDEKNNQQVEFGQSKQQEKK